MTITHTIKNRIRRIAGTRPGELLLDAAEYLRLLRRGIDPDDGYPFETLKLLKPIRVTVEAKDYAPGNVPPYTLVAPVKNEAAGIEGFLESIEAQTAAPAEAIIVDGGSTDKTVAIMKRFAKRSRVKFTIISIKSRSISQQRNLGVSRASSEIIVFADAGCRLDPRYGANLAGSLAAHPKASLAGGIFFASPRDLADRFEFRWDSLARWNRYLPAGKCMAVRRNDFLSMGGFAEHLPYSGEDYLFDVTIRRHSREWVINRNASVTWEIPSTMAGAKKKYRAYGEGDGQNGLGDCIHYAQMREYARTKRIAHDELGTELFRGFLEGRKDRAQIEIERRKIGGLVFVLADGLVTTGPDREEKLEALRGLTKKNMKVIYVAQGQLRPALPRFIDADLSLVELYTGKNLPLKEIAKRYAALKGKVFICGTGDNNAGTAAGIRRSFPEAETVGLYMQGT